MTNVQVRRALKDRLVELLAQRDEYSDTHVNLWAARIQELRHIAWLLRVDLED